MELEQIQTIKIQGDGYLVNSNLFVPKVDGNRYYGILKEWLKTNTPEPEFTDTELLGQEQVKFRAERNNLLNQVDIEINKGLDNGIDVSALRTYRQELRDATVAWVLPTHP